MSNYKTVLLSKNRRLVSALGYIDTGNFLTDCKTKRPVAVASPEVMLELLPEQYHIIIKDYQKGSFSLSNHNVDMDDIGMHIIPYNTICSKDELMLAFDCDFFFIDNKFLTKKPLIGISRESFSLLHTNMCILLNRKFIKRGLR